MTREEIIAKITEKESWGDLRVKDKFLDELQDASKNEGCEWGDVAPSIIELYRHFQRDYFSKNFYQALHEEIINMYAYMLEWSEVVEYPEVERLVKVPARKVREWYG